MALSAGSRLGPYEIVSPLGAGGMGEVYRARDTRLDRIVAIKVLPPELAADPQLRDRFDREARAISSLNHPHICALYDVGHERAVDFLVLEYLDGRTLADRLTAGPLAVDEALRYAIQICEALDGAHRAGIVHRDLKPANVMLTKAGAKLLDFGLARSAAPVVSTSTQSMWPTTPPTLTAQGTILGTFQYMAPEQIEGIEADSRTDIFAFGALLFEMITGRPAFEGKTRASLLGAILKDRPPALSLALPPTGQARGSTGSSRSELLDRIVATCLEKDPEDRYQSARDLLRDLKWSAFADATVSTSAAMTATSRRRTIVRRATTGLAFIAAGVVVGALLMLKFRPVTGVEPIQFTVPAPDKHTFGGPPSGGTGPATQLALSADGRQLAFVAAASDIFQLWVRTSGTLTPRLITGTEGATFPFWSPDSRHIAFFAGGKLKRVAVAGGPPVVLCDASLGHGGTWNRDNVILFGAASAGAMLQRVSAAGGTPIAASKVDEAYGETSHRWPHFLPDGRHFVFTAVIGVCCPANKPAQVRVGSLDSNDVIRLFQGDSSVQYSSGHLLFSRGGTLMAQPFDVDSRAITGEAFPAAEQVNTEGSRYSSFSISANGVLAYAHGTAQTATRLIWRDRSGRILGTVGDPAMYLQMALSPDERRIAVTLPSATTDTDMWTVDAVRGTMSRLILEPSPDVGVRRSMTPVPLRFPIWSPDGTRVAFQSDRGGKIVLLQKYVSGTAREELVPADAGIPTPTDWSSDGRFIAFNRSGAGVAGGVDVWAVPVGGDKKPFPVVATPFADSTGTFSPDVRWIAYVSNETGINEVYVQPFPPSGGRYQASRNGGVQPRWRSDGKELYFLTTDGRLMAVSVDGTRSQFEMGIPQPLFVTASAQISTGRHYAVSSDGQRFLINSQMQQGTGEPITVLINWPATIQK